MIIVIVAEIGMQRSEARFSSSFNAQECLSIPRGGLTHATCRGV